MIGKVRMAIAGGIVLCVIPMVVLSQNITVPTSMKNTRFYSDIFNIKRPGLSMNGYDNGGDNSHSSRSQSRFGNAQREAPLPQQRKRDYSKCFRI